MYMYHQRKFSIPVFYAVKLIKFISNFKKCFGKFYVTKVRLNYILNKLIYIPL